MALPTSRNAIGGAFGAGILALALLWPADMHAQSRGTTTELPALLTADEVVVDEDLGLVTAQGHVEISQGQRMLKADALTYNRRTNVVTASGDVSIVEPTGEVVFADFVELTSDLRDGALRNLRLLIADQSRFAAVTARRADGSKTVMRKATYSPCEPCREDPTKAPMWQIRAQRITHDEEKKEVVYDNAWLEIAGVPVAYTPYLSHPDGTENRKSGFLIPDAASSSRNGSMFAVPYYYAISPYADATFTPIILTNDAPLMAAEYREQAKAGKVEFNGSFLNTRRDGEGFGAWRGHARGNGQFDFTDDWRGGFDFARASDKTYIDRYRMRQRFRFLDQETLESRAYVEGFRDRGYAVMDAFAFQGLRPEDSSRTSPYVMPEGAYQWIGEPGVAGGRFGFDAQSASIYRQDGVVSQRASMIGSWLLPYTTQSGEIYTLSAGLQTDLFHATSSRPGADAFQPSETGVNARVLPQVGLSWRYPLVRRGESLRVLVEPTTGVYLAPNLGSQRQLANEDSRGLSFDDTNLFRTNRFSGYDRVETGARFIYGLNTEIANRENQRAGIFVGQQYRSSREQAAPIGSGVETTFSDVVGRVFVVPHPWVSSTYRFQVDNSDHRLLRSIAGMSLGPPALRYSVSHARIDRAIQPTATASINQLAHAVSTRMSENWRLEGRVIQSLGADNGILIAGTTLFYEDDCFLWGIDLTRRNIGRAEIPPDTALLFRIAFRNLGELALRGL